MGEASFGEVFPFPLALVAEEGSSDLQDEADGSRLRMRLAGGAAAAVELMYAILVRARHS